MKAEDLSYNRKYNAVSKYWPRLSSIPIYNRAQHCLNSNSLNKNKIQQLYFWSPVGKCGWVLRNKMCVRGTSGVRKGQLLFSSFSPCHLEYSTVDKEITMKMKATCKRWQRKNTGALCPTSCRQASPWYSRSRFRFCLLLGTEPKASCTPVKCSGLSHGPVISTFSLVVSSSSSSFYETGFTM